MTSIKQETLPGAVTDYYFSNGGDEPISFSKLPLKWDENADISCSDSEPIFLTCNSDNDGLQTLCKQVKAWKYDLSKESLEISVHCKDDDHWFKLQKPRKSYENEMMTIMITLQSLYFFKCEPEAASGEALWDHLSQVFSLYDDVRPSEDDLIDHMDFIREAVKRDETLAKSEFLAAFLANPRKSKFPDQDADDMNVDARQEDEMNVDERQEGDMNVDERQEDDLTTKASVDSESDDEFFAPYDTVCAICDYGGELICCEGGCLRSFHATEESEDAIGNDCISLGLTPEEVLEGPFWCENCLRKRHQCFVCGELGSSDKSSVAEVFRCSSENCGHFYHPRCVATLLKSYGEAEPNLHQKIAAGEPFICPAHKCIVCKQTENPKVEDLQFAVCRRCPMSYHRKCLPSEIKFDNDIGDDDDYEFPRAWDELLPKSRALIYCLRHEIDEEIGTPARNLKFENVGYNSIWDKLATIELFFLTLVKALYALALGYDV